MQLNALIPELYVASFEKSIAFYTNVLGFSIEYQRTEDGFAFLSLGESQIMIDQIDKGRTWKTGAFNHPFGRGINFQIKVENIDPLLMNCKKNNIKLFLEPEEIWYRQQDVQVGTKQFLVQDPDGYLLRFFQVMETKSL